MEGWAPPLREGDEIGQFGLGGTTTEAALAAHNKLGADSGVRL